jgi:hypothetical protein
MKKMTMILMIVALLTGSVPLFAAEAGKTDKAGAVSAQAPKDTVFNRLSNFLSGFDRPMTRRGNQQGFWQATADWMRNINKE